MRISKTAGRVALRDDTVAMSYIVTRGNLCCSVCDRLMPAGERFTRSKVAGGGMATYPMCRDCRPFTDHYSVEARQEVRGEPASADAKRA